MNSLWNLGLCGLALLVAAAAGCDSESGGLEGTGGNGTGGGGGTGGTGGGETIPVVFQIRGMTEPGLEGVQICEADTTNCATTDENGSAGIELPANREVLYTVSKDGYASELYADETPFAGLRNHVLFTNQEIDDAAGGVGSMWPHAGTGWASFGVNLAGVTFQLIEASGVQWYINSEGVGTTEIDATTTEAIGGARGGFVEVAPGIFEVEYGGAATNCTVGIGWPSETPNRLRIPVRDGHISYASMTCDAQ